MASRSRHPAPCGAGEDYRSGPTACVASPGVLKDIKKQISRSGILSMADSRLAAKAGLVNIPFGGNTGFNDGVIYPPEEGTGGGAGPKALHKAGRMFALAKPKGLLNCLVLLVDFSDNKGTKTPAHFQSLLFDPNNPNSMHSFYKEMSSGKLKVSGQVTNWIRAKKPYSYYTNGQSGTGNSFPKNTPGLLQEVLETYCATNNLSGFDLNGDGFVDGLFLVHAGGGAESESNAAKRAGMIWSHKWTLPSAFKNKGVKAYAYFTAPEDGKLGVFSHEFGHFLGLPDLYDTSYRSHGIGAWCLMAAGSWGGGGDTPARLSAWCLSNLGWITPTNVTAAATLSMKPLADDMTACYRLWTAGKASKEYFLIENRQRAGRDISLPASGLAVWHIDETQSNNTNPLAYRVALVQADGKRDLELLKNQGDAGDIFPGSKAVTSLSSAGTTHPHTRDNSGAATGVALSAISATGGLVSVKVKVS